MSLEQARHQIFTCLGSEDHIHEIKFLIVENSDTIIFEPNRFIKDRWNSYICLQGAIDIRYTNTDTEPRLEEIDAILSAIDADTSGYISYTVIDDKNFTVRLHSDWYPKNELVEYQHPIWLSNMFESRIFQVQGYDVIMKRTFVSQKRFRFLDDNVSELRKNIGLDIVADTAANHYRFSYCILEENHSIDITPTDENAKINLIGNLYTVNGKYMESVDYIDGSNSITVEAKSGNCYITMVEKYDLLTS
jgi:hypothetical protein